MLFLAGKYKKLQNNNSELIMCKILCYSKILQNGPGMQLTVWKFNHKITGIQSLSLHPKPQTSLNEWSCDSIKPQWLARWLGSLILWISFCLWGKPQGCWSYDQSCDTVYPMNVVRIISRLFKKGNGLYIGMNQKCQENGSDL